MASKTIEIEGLAEQVKQLKKMMSGDQYFRRRVNAIIKAVLNAARKEVMANAEGAMDNDPRHAYMAVRSTVYRRILGGNLNILSRRKAGAPSNYQKPKKGLPKRGGNRWKRSQRTIELEGYEGKDRGFILRFVNAGATDRKIKSYTSPKDNARHDLLSARKGGSRGNIAARNWFGSASQKALENASYQLQEYIDQLINEEFI